MITRRKFLPTSAAAAAATSLPMPYVRAQSNTVITMGALKLIHSMPRTFSTKAVQPQAGYAVESHPR